MKIVARYYGKNGTDYILVQYLNGSSACYYATKSSTFGLLVDFYPGAKTWVRSRQMDQKIKN
jgi:hypothetical protein